VNTDSATLETTSTIAFAPRVVVEHSDDEIHDSQKADVQTSSRGTESLQTSQRKYEYLLTPRPTPTRELEERSKDISSSNNSVTTNGFSLPPHISGLEVTNHQLLATFVNFFAKNPNNRVFNTWMGELPRILADPTSLAVKRSIVAAAMIHSAGLLTNKDILIEGYKWYGASLSSQRRELAVINQVKRKPTFEELCTPLMLSFCEISCCTSQTAYFHHLLGAAELLSRHDPGRCTKGILLEIFQVLRLQLVSGYKRKSYNYSLLIQIYPTIIMRIPSVLGTPDWLTKPFGLRPKTSVDISIDTIIVCSELVSLSMHTA